MSKIVKTYELVKLIAKQMGALKTNVESSENQCAVENCSLKDNLSVIFCDHCESQVVCYSHTIGLSVHRKCPVCENSDALQRRWAIPIT